MNESHPLYRWYVLAVLTLVYVFNFVDRQILVVLQEPIKADLNLSDTQLGLLTGLLFAMFYVTLGIPIARIADKGNRRNVIAISISVWSLMTAVSGFVTAYWHLVLARIGVGVGEAGGSPPSHSIISDYFPPEIRTTALAIFSSGIYIGVMVGFLAGGFVNDQFGWRVAFFAVGIPGLLVALLVRFTVKEPPRGRYDKPSEDELPNTKQAIAIFWKMKTFRYIALGCAFAAFSGYAFSNWSPSFMIRHHGISVGEAGLLFALLIGLGGLTGALFGGVITDRFGRRDKRWYLWLPGLASLSGVPLMIMALLSDNYVSTVWLFIWPVVTSACYMGPSVAICHSLVQPKMRSLISAVLFFVINLIGLGLGPLFVGVISDQLTPTMGIDGLRYALITSTALGALSTLFFFLAAREINNDSQKAKQQTGSFDDVELKPTTAG